MDQNLNNNLNFIKDRIEIIQNFLEVDFIQFIQDYFAIKINSNQYDINDSFTYGYSFYSDPLMETILQNSCEAIHNITEVEVLPTYSETKMLMNGDTLTSKDIESSEISAFLCLGYSNDTKPYINLKSNLKIDLNPGDLIVYNNIRVKPWIDFVENQWLLQSSLNFVDNKGPYKNNIYDKRPYLGFK